MAFSLARNVYKGVSKLPLGQRFLERGGKELIGQSLPGALITTGISTMVTGNPFAGALVGGADLVSSSVLARGLASTGLNNFLARKGLPQTAGRFHRSVDLSKARTMRDVAKQPLVYHSSMPQNMAMLVGSVGSTLALEPMFYPQRTAQTQQLAELRYMTG